MMPSRGTVSRRTLSAVGFVMSLAACGGGGGGHSTAVPQAVATAKPAISSVNITLTIPARSTLSRRRAAYISPSTQSMQFNASPGAVVTDVNLTAPLCSTNGTTGDKSCTFTVSAPVGNDTFTVVAYDEPFTAGVLPGGTNALSGASSFAVTVTEGSANISVPLITGGVPATVALSLGGGASTFSLTGATSTALTVTAYDADGNIIVAPGAFANASGTATPLTIASANGTSGFGYAVTSAVTGTTGAAGATIALSEPDDTVALMWNGTSYVPATDTLTLAGGLTNHGGGGTTTAYSFGYRIPASSLPFAPTFLMPMDAAVATAVGHKGLLIAAPPNKAGFIGDTTSTCTIASIEGGSVTAMGGATLDEPDTPVDTHFYLTLTDTNLRISSEYTIASVLAGGSCVENGAAGGIDDYTPGGIAAANNTGIDVTTYGGVSQVEAYAPLQSFSSVYSTGTQLTLFNPRAVAMLPSGSSGLVTYDDKKVLVGYNGYASQTGSEGLAGMTDGYPVGVTVDPSGNIYANDTTSATFGVNGGVAMFSSITSGIVASAKLNAAIVATGPTYQEQNMTVGARGTGSALYVACGDGIEVFALPMTGTLNAPVETITTPASAVSVAGNHDGRVWVLLSDGSIDVLPPQ
jgi:hypothetical protein